MKNIKAVLFDFDDTLGNRQQYAYDAYGDFIREEMPELTDEAFIEAIKQDLCTAHQFGNAGFGYAAQFVANKYGIRMPDIDYKQWWNLNMSRHTCLSDDTIETLEALKDKYRLGIITNGTHYSQWNKIRLTGIEKYFELIMVSQDVGFEKPDKRIFLAASDKLGLRPEECMYIGDTYSNDVYGAYNAGMNAVWIWHDPIRACNTPVTRITKISQVLDLLGER
ncbi:MAG: HAD family hydrolase [Erysipelotrichaceae bacterium]|nr:HAD family hydrolase [Erysipelotrichaceae bacterium]